MTDVEDVILDIPVHARCGGRRGHEERIGKPRLGCFHLPHTGSSESDGEEWRDIHYPE